MLYSMTTIIKLKIFKLLAILLEHLIRTAVLCTILVIILVSKKIISV